MSNDIEKFSQADELIKAFHCMDNNELKFMFYALSQREKGQLSIKTTMSDIIKKLHIEHGGNQMKLYLKVMKDIRTKSDIAVEMRADRLPDWKESGYLPDDIIEVGGSLISSKRNTRTNEITIQFKQEFLPLLDELKYNHTWILLEQIAKLDGKYSPRFYEFCKMHLKDERSTSFIWYLDSDSKKAPGIRQFLNVTNKYKAWKDLKRRVIDPSITEINEKCEDMFISYQPLKNKWIYAIEIKLSKYAIGLEYKEDPSRRSNRNRGLRVVEREVIKKVNSNLYNWLE